jgi:hypothetical protein
MNFIAASVHVLLTKFVKLIWQRIDSEHTTQRALPAGNMIVDGRT